MNGMPPATAVFRIAIFQALQLGDLLCTTPALRALRAHFPNAELTLIGSAWARDMADRLPGIDRFFPFPGYAGIAQSPATPLTAAPEWPPFDLVIQMHGAGNVSNGFAASLGGLQSLGHGDAHDIRLTLSRTWQEAEPEPLRWLRLISLLGVPDAGFHLDFPFTPDEQHEAHQRIGPRDGLIVGVHVGASVPERRWPAARFAAVIDGLATTMNCTFVLTGSVAERALATRVQAAARTPVIDLAGATTLGEFGAVIAQLDLLLTNDTGASHVAAAVNTPSVVLFGPADPRRWAPLDASRHRVINARDHSSGLDDASALQALPAQVVLDTCLEVLRAARLSMHAASRQEQVA